MACAQLGTREESRGPKPPAKLDRAEMTKTRGREEQGMPLTRRATFAPPSEVDRNERAASWNERCTFLGPVCSNRVSSPAALRRLPPSSGKSCPLLRPLGRTTPAAGAHREPPTEGSTMRLVKLVIAQTTERIASRSRCACSKLRARPRSGARCEAAPTSRGRAMLGSREPAKRRHELCQHPTNPRRL
jgi:hypothetical protein